MQALSYDEMTVTFEDSERVFFPTFPPLLLSPQNAASIILIASYEWVGQERMALLLWGEDASRSRP